MIDSTLTEWLTWWDTVSPEFAFLLALPYVVAAIGLFEELTSIRSDQH